MNRLLGAAAIAAALVAPFTPVLPETQAHAKTPVGGCSPRDKPAYYATGSWSPWGVTLAGRTSRYRFGRDVVTTIRVPGIGTYAPAGGPREFYSGTVLRRAPLAYVTVRINFGGTHRCTFRLARHR